MAMAVPWAQDAVQEASQCRMGDARAAAEEAPLLEADDDSVSLEKKLTIANK